MALGGCLLLFIAAALEKHWEEVYCMVGVTLWLFFNYWWMASEVHFIPGLEDDATGATQGSYIGEAGIAILGFFFLVLNPLRFFNRDPEQDHKYAELGLIPHTPSFITHNWRQYDHLHSICWLGKDISWSRMNKPGWVIFVIPTISISTDMLITTFRSGLWVDFCHYLAQFTWVVANIVWAAGEVFAPYEGAFDTPTTFKDGLQHTTVHTVHDDATGAADDFDTWTYAHKSPRWFACWLVVFAFVPIAVLYFCIIPYSLITGTDIEKSPTNIVRKAKERRASQIMNIGLDAAGLSEVVASAGGGGGGGVDTDADAAVEMVETRAL
jgi:hypothetical protein